VKKELLFSVCVFLSSTDITTSSPSVFVNVLFLAQIRILWDLYCWQGLLLLFDLDDYQQEMPYNLVQLFTIQGEQMLQNIVSAPWQQEKHLVG
jgi:hypothetical protein